MKIIKYQDYNLSKGMLIDLEEPASFKKNHYYEAINVPYEKLLANYKRILDKEKKYYFYCRKGHKSKKVCNILEYYGYDVTQVTVE